MELDFRSESRILGAHLEAGLSAIGKGIENGLKEIAEAMKKRPSSVIGARSPSESR